MRRPLLGVLVGGLTAGTFDLLYAIIVQFTRRQRSPEWTLQSVATGWLGKDAWEGGAGSAVLGLVSHYGIALAAATLFYLVSKRVAFLRERAVLSGLIFGVGVFVVMNYVVVPLSAAPFTMPTTFRFVAENVSGHAILFGLPIALAVRYFSTPRATPANAG